MLRMHVWAMGSELERIAVGHLGFLAGSYGILIAAPDRMSGKLPDPRHRVPDLDKNARRSLWQ